MNIFPDQQNSDSRKPGGILSGLRIFDSIINWLTGFLQLTEKEQDEAGIYLGDHDDR
jgi:hypothetical protein